MNILKKFNVKSIMTLFAKKNWLFIVGITGILLIFVSDFIAAPSEEKIVEENNPQEQITQFAQYEQELTEKLVGLLSSVEGAGQVRVMLTLETTGEQIYAENETYESQTTQTQPAQQQHSTQTELVVLEKDEIGQEPVTQTQVYPIVKGVAVVCQGAENITVVRRITDLVSVVLGISTNRVCVEKMTYMED